MLIVLFAKGRKYLPDPSRIPFPIKEIESLVRGGVLDETMLQRPEEMMAMTKLYADALKSTYEIYSELEKLRSSSGSRG